MTIWHYSLLRFLIRNTPPLEKRLLRRLASTADRGDQDARAEFYRRMNLQFGEACRSKEQPL